MRTFAARVLAWSCFGVLAFSFPAVHAQSNSFDLDPTKIDVHGFVSQGFILSTKNNYLALSKRGSPEFTEVGLNFTKAFSDDIRVGAQLFAR